VTVAAHVHQAPESVELHHLRVRLRLKSEEAAQLRGQQIYKA
jgi:hypothetical protein